MGAAAEGVLLCTDQVTKEREDIHLMQEEDRLVLFLVIRYCVEISYWFFFQVSQAFCTSEATCAGVFEPRPISCKPVLMTL